MNLKKTSICLLAIVFAAIMPLALFAQNDESKPIVLKTMGSLFFGGSVVDQTENSETFHGDHGYAQYYIPQNSRNYPLIMWHGIGQSGKTYESTPDGREGFQAILTRRDWPVYIIDQPRRGRAGRTKAALGENTVPTTLMESSAWNAFRFGLWVPPNSPTAFPNVQMPMDGYTIDQFFRQQTPDTGEEPETREYRQFMARTMRELLKATGPSVLVTHSNSGQYGWETAIVAQEWLKAVVSYEPGNYVFPEGETPANIPIGETDFGRTAVRYVPVAEFKKLTQMPILIVFGDNIAAEPSNVFNSEVWRISGIRGKQFVEAVNRHGGDAKIVFLPDLGMKGNTHIPFSDLNNLEVADQLEGFLSEKKLDGREQPHQGPKKHEMELTIPLKKEP